MLNNSLVENVIVRICSIENNNKNFNENQFIQMCILMEKSLSKENCLNISSSGLYVMNAT